MGKRERFKSSTSVFLFAYDGDRVLLIKRGNTGWMDGYFSVPAGGVDGNETFATAAIREAYEEVGITVKPEDLTLAHVLHSRTDGEEWTGIFFATSKWIGEPVINEPHKHSELRWSEISKLPDNMVPYVATALKACAGGQGYSEYGW